MKMDDAIRIADIIAESFYGDLTAEKKETLRLWLGKNDANRRKYERMAAKYKASGYRENAFDEFEAYKNFEHTLHQARLMLPETQIRKRRKAWKKIAAAACLLIPAALAAAFLLTGNGGERPAAASPKTPILVIGGRTQVEIMPGVPAVADGVELINTDNGGAILSYSGEDLSGAPPQTHRLIIPAGIDWKVRLPDGTVAHLDAGAEIEYPDRFTQDTRTVKTKGRIYFDVAHGEIPFVVAMSSGRVTVHGTEFCVEDFETGNGIVTLVKGSVSVTAGTGRPSMLSPGQQATISAAACEIRNVETIYHTAWKDGYFMYRETKLRDVMNDITRWYGMDCEYRDTEAMECRVTARVLRYETIDPVLSFFSDLSNLEITRSENKVLVGH